MIPKHLHFIFGLAPKEPDHQPYSHQSKSELVTSWGLVHYVCIKSAIEKIKPSNVSFYVENEPDGPWWELTKQIVDIIPVTGPNEIFGRPVTHYAHKADVIRLEKLIEYGGIYLDVDVFVHEDFDSLLSRSVVMGLEGEGGLCNAVILAEKEAPFIKDWYSRYNTFDDSRWSQHSVILPYQLSSNYGAEIEKRPEGDFFWPTWRANDIYRMFGKKGGSARGRFANHLWEQRARYYLGGLNPGHVRKIDSAFNHWARPYVLDFPDDFGGGIDYFYGLPRQEFALLHNRGRQLKAAIRGE